MGKRAFALRSALATTKAELFGSNARLAASAGLTILASYGSFKAQQALGREWPGDELIPVVVGPIAFCLVFILLLVFHWLFRAPYDEWTRAEERANELHRRLAPRFSVYPMVGQKPLRLSYGNTLISMGGTRQTIITHGSSEVLMLDVTNESASMIEGCEAYLSEFDTVIETEPKFWQPLRLPWVLVGEAQGSFNVPPLGTRSIILFSVVNNHVHLVNDRGVPVPMVHAIQPVGEYRGLVTITAEKAPVTLVAFELVCNAPEAPYINVMRRYIGESDDMPWAREREIV